MLNNRIKVTDSTLINYVTSITKWRTVWKIPKRNDDGKDTTSYVNGAWYASSEEAVSPSIGINIPPPPATWTLEAAPGGRVPSHITLLNYLNAQLENLEVTLQSIPAIPDHPQTASEEREIANQKDAFLQAMYTVIAYEQTFNKKIKTDMYSFLRGSLTQIVEAL